MKLLVVGASGLVGSHILRIAKERGHEALGTYRTLVVDGLIPLDINDQEPIRALMTSCAPDAVVCCAAWSWVDGCENEPERAYRENRDNPRLIAEVAHQVGATFMHFSSSYVFDGRAGPYREEDQPNPISIYGMAKLAGENAVMEVCRGNALIVRTMGVYGEESQRKNFVYQVIDNLTAGKRMRIPIDQFGNSTYAGDLAEGCLRLLERKDAGIWNLAGPDPNVSRSDFARRIARDYGLNENLFDFSTTIQLSQSAARPLQGGLLINKARNAIQWNPHEWVPFSR